MQRNTIDRSCFYHSTGLISWPVTNSDISLWRHDQTLISQTNVFRIIRARRITTSQIGFPLSERLSDNKVRKSINTENKKLSSECVSNWMIRMKSWFNLGIIRVWLLVFAPVWSPASCVNKYKILLWVTCTACNRTSFSFGDLLSATYVYWCAHIANLNDFIILFSGSPVDIINSVWTKIHMGWWQHRKK